MSNDIEQTFDRVVSGLKKSMLEHKHHHAVDIELRFESMEVSSSGVPIISRRNKRKDLMVRLATRITPEE
ncbi:hypothetical protein QLX67_10450 [Balneolaceae bacterium ANBcel3]|nr:hypothetical protein [Balneolaceae bacterium ANBcel3]